jgi:hypothetical protein
VRRRFETARREDDLGLGLGQFGQFVNCGEKYGLYILISSQIIYIKYLL